MTDIDRRKVTFEQAEGFEPLPRQLALKELTPHLRAGLFAVVHHSLWEGVDPYDRELVQPWKIVLKRHFVTRRAGMADEFALKVALHEQWLKKTIQLGTYAQALGLIQWLVRQPEMPDYFAEFIAVVLERNLAAYRLIDQTIMPISSEEVVIAVKRAAADLSSSRFAGARQHLRNAAELLSGSDWAGGTRESIHAVESVIRVITGESTFGAALKVIDQKWKIHPALRDGFNKLYGYTNGEKGIRHPLLDEGKAAVGESEALFMFGACASLVSFLVGKDNQGR